MIVLQVLQVLFLAFIAIGVAGIADHLGVPLPWQRKVDQ